MAINQDDEEGNEKKGRTECNTSAVTGVYKRDEVGLAEEKARKRESEPEDALYFRTLQFEVPLRASFSAALLAPPRRNNDIQ